MYGKEMGNPQPSYRIYIKYTCPLANHVPLRGIDEDER